MIIFLEGWEGERLSLREYSSFSRSLYAYAKLLYSEVAAENATSTYISYSWLIFDNTGHYYVTVYRKIKHNMACVNVREKVSRILKIALNKLTEGNGYVECIENHLSYDYNTWKLKI